tara:strand:- start:691 stop:1014 length:324 start_codon:yes stop_codon:yes gene_type:complete
MKKLSTALAVIGLLAVPLTASATEVSREKIAANVSTTGLDLSKAEDVAKLRDRMKRAIANACATPDDQISPSASPDWQCQREMSANAEGTVLQLARQHAALSHMASN